MKKASNLNERVLDIKYQVPYPFILDGEKMFTYLLDFEVTYGDGSKQYVDVKGFKTSEYKIKKKIIQKAFGIIITEK